MSGNLVFGCGGDKKRKRAFFCGTVMAQLHNNDAAFFSFFIGEKSKIRGGWIFVRGKSIVFNGCLICGDFFSVFVIVRSDNVKAGYTY
jgi:hypothetical protein